MALRILLSGGLADGGVRTHILLLTKALRRRGAAVTIASAATNWTAADLRELKSTGTQIHTTPWGFGRTAVLGKVQALLTWPLLLDGHYDVILCVGYGRMHQFVRSRYGRDTPVIFHEVVDAPQRLNAATDSVRRMTGIISNSKPVSERWSALVPALPIRTIPFLTLETHAASGALRKQGGDELRAVYLGRIVSHKRIDWLVKNWAEIEREVGPVRLDVHGADYPGERLEDSLRSSVHSAGLSDRVAFHGPYRGAEELRKILERADVVLLPSLYEGLPLVLVEAMAAGVPFVATDAGGTADLGRDNPDVEVTGTSEVSFTEGMKRLVARIRAGSIDRARLIRWTAERYGPGIVEERWIDALASARQWAPPSTRYQAGF